MSVDAFIIANMLLETKRLIIRPYREDDFEECFLLMQDPRLFNYLDMHVMARAEYEHLFRWIIACYQISPNADFKYSFNIVRKEDGRHIGWCGLGGAEFDHGRKEIYWLIGTEYQSNGYCTEAAAALLAFGFQMLRLNEIEAYCQPGNTASRRVMEKIGLRSAGVISGLPEQHAYYNGEFFYRLSRDEYLKNSDSTNTLTKSTL